MHLIKKKIILINFHWSSTLAKAEGFTQELEGTLPSEILHILQGDKTHAPSNRMENKIESEKFYNREMNKFQKVETVKTLRDKKQKGLGLPHLLVNCLT